jgi:hypothetical protein
MTQRSQWPGYERAMLTHICISIEHVSWPQWVPIPRPSTRRQRCVRTCQGYWEGQVLLLRVVHRWTCTNVGAAAAGGAPMNEYQRKKQVNLHTKCDQFMANWDSAATKVFGVIQLQGCA